MTIINFLKEFKDDNVCRKHFKKIREKAGIKCKNCLGNEHYWLPSKEQWQCKECGFRTTLRSGTIMESSKLSFHTWYTAMAFMSFSKKGISASELQRQLDHSRYETVWKLMHKIRKVMGQRDGLYLLEDMIEIDKAYIKVETTEYEKSKTKRGRGSTDLQAVTIMAESTPLENIDTGKKSRHVRFYKMKVLENHTADAIENNLEEAIDEDIVLFTDQNRSYSNLADIVSVHVSEKSSHETTVSTLKWVHIAISNLKRNFLGIYHKIKRKHLQNYLNEFCYKLNRRYFNHGLFDRLVLAHATSYW